MVNDNTKTQTKVETMNRYRVYAFKDLSINKTWGSIRNKVVIASSYDDATRKAIAAFPNAEKYKSFFMRAIIGDWSH